MDLVKNIDQGLTLSIGTKKKGFYLRTEKDSMLRNVFQLQKEIDE
jgi:hypothetical protein